MRTLDAQVTDITAAEVKLLLDKGEPIILVDVRTDEEQSVRRFFVRPLMMRWPHRAGRAANSSCGVPC